MNVFFFFNLGSKTICSSFLHFSITENTIILSVKPLIIHEQVNEIMKRSLKISVLIKTYNNKVSIVKICFFYDFTDLNAIYLIRALCYYSVCSTIHIVQVYPRLVNKNCYCLLKWSGVKILYGEGLWGNKMLSLNSYYNNNVVKRPTHSEIKYDEQ